MDQANRKPRLICNYYAAPDDVTLNFNVSTNKSTAPNAIQFGACLTLFLQKIWEAHPSNGPVWIFKCEIIDAFH